MEVIFMGSVSTGVSGPDDEDEDESEVRDMEGRLGEEEEKIFSMLKCRVIYERVVGEGDGARRSTSSFSSSSG